MAPGRLLRRYRNAYRIGKFINGVGLLAQLLGFVAAILLVIAGGMIASKIDPADPVVQWTVETFKWRVQDVQAAIFSIGVAMALVTLPVLWVAGVLVSGVGQMLKAVLDTAVHTSPFLNEEEKLKVIR